MVREGKMPHFEYMYLNQIASYADLFPFEVQNGSILIIINRLRKTAPQTRLGM